MDKWIETPWVVKLIALSLAALLFISVSFEPESQTFGFNTPSAKDSQTVEAVPVEVYYDQENVVVSGIPKTVDVTLSGPKNILIRTVQARDFKVFIDLSEAELGTRNVKFQVDELSDKLSYTIEPSEAEVTIEEKVTEEFTVEPEYDRSLLEDGYLAEVPTVEPKTVQVTGGKEVIEQIAYVKAVINVKETAKGVVEISAPIQVLDRDLNKLDVSMAPEYVTVKLQIKSPSKTVDIHPVASGNPMDGVTITSLTADPETITLYGKNSILETINELQVPIDISKLDKNESLTVPVDLPDGVTSASVDEVTVNVKVSKSDSEDATVPGEEEEEPEPEGSGDSEEANASKTFEGIAIRQTGLEDGYSLSFLSPSQGTTSVSVTGKQSIINSLSASDIQVSMNVSSLSEGEHSAPLQVKLPANLKGQAGISAARVLITKNADDSQEPVEGQEDSVSLLYYRENYMWAV